MTTVLLGGLGRESLQAGHPSVRAGELQREALLQPAPPDARTGKLVREALVAGSANTFVRSAALVREVLMPATYARIAGLAREALLHPVPPYVFVGGAYREVLFAPAALSNGLRPVLFIVT